MRFRISGDLGDTVYALSLMSVRPGEHSLYCVDRPGVTAPFVVRVPLLQNLIESQPYIKEVKCTEEEVDYDFTPFRRYHNAITTLIEAMQSELVSQTGDIIDADGREPWITAEPADGYADKVVIARSPRYQNDRFPWKQIVHHYGKRLVFIGLPSEHAAFVEQFGRVDYKPTKDFLEVAQLIKGSALFIGNQSSPMSVAIGLGHPFIQEVCLWQPDCIYKRDNGQYSANGNVFLPDVDGSGDLDIPELKKPPITLNKTIVPPGGWQYPKLPISKHFEIQVKIVMDLEKCSKEEATQKLAEHNLHRIPDFFRPMISDPLETFWQAHKKAFSEKPNQANVIL